MHNLATIVIPQRGHLDLTLQCLRTLREHDRFLWPVIVVDDGSTDSPDLGALAREPHVRLLRQRQRGVTAAWNVGWSAATTPYIIFLNNDVVSHGEWIHALLEPLINGSVEITGVRLRREEFLPLALLQRLPTHEVLEGWCFAIRREVLRRLDGFDETLTTYWSDTDLELRLVARRSRPTPLLAVGALPLKHIGHATAHDEQCLPRRREIWHADRARFIAKWKRRLHADLVSR